MRQASESLSASRGDRLAYRGCSLLAPIVAGCAVARGRVARVLPAAVPIPRVVKLLGRMSALRTKGATRRRTASGTSEPKEPRTTPDRAQRQRQASLVLTSNGWASSQRMGQRRRQQSPGGGAPPQFAFFAQNPTLAHRRGTLLCVSVSFRISHRRAGAAQDPMHFGPIAPPSKPNDPGTTW